MSRFRLPRTPGFATLSLHAGRRPDPVQQTTAVLEERLAALEGGVGAVAAASGQAALHLAIATLMGAGGHIVASAALGEGTARLLASALPRFGITTTLVAPRDPDGFRRAIRPETRLVLGETIGGPGLDVLDIPALARLAHDAGLPLLVDNTAATAYLCRPIEHGADIVVQGGMVVDGGGFHWRDSGRFPELAEAEDEFGPAAFALQARGALADLGACLSPADAAPLLQGVETLSLRMRRHMENTAAVVDFLAGNPQVEKVVHPSRPDHPDHALARALLPRGAGAVVGLAVAGGARFVEALKLASATIEGDMVRLSVGLEDTDDILADLGQALKVAGK